METDEYPEGHPMMAQPALQQGKLLGRNIVKLIQNKRMEPFEYNEDLWQLLGVTKRW
jgi:NADH dehydrogenase